MSQTDSSAYSSEDNTNPKRQDADGTVHFRHYRRGERRAFSYAGELPQLREDLGQGKAWRVVRREIRDLEEISATAADGELTI